MKRSHLKLPITRKLRLAIVSASLLASALPAHADTLITFEESSTGLTAMGNSFTLVPTYSQLSNQYLASNGVSFSSLAGYVALVDHGPGNPTASYPTIIGGTTTGGFLNYGSPITISFFDMANTSLKATTSFFKIQGDWYPLGYGSIFATAYGVAGNVLGSTSDTDNKIFGVSGPVLQFNFAGIHSVVINGDTNTVGFDNLEYGALITAVPEPETYAMMLAGLGLMGAVARRRKQKNA